MKMTLNLTFEDGMKVVEAMKEVAVEHGWDIELAECGIIEEYSRVIDAALAAMGISVSIAGEPEVEDYDDLDDEDWDEEWDEDEEDGYFNSDDDDDDDATTYSLTAKGEFVLKYMEAGHSFEEACEIADALFGEGE